HSVARLVLGFGAQYEGGWWRDVGAAPVRPGPPPPPPLALGPRSFSCNLMHRRPPPVQAGQSRPIPVQNDPFCAIPPPARQLRWGPPTHVRDSGTTPVRAVSHCGREGEACPCDDEAGGCGPPGCSGPCP